MPSSSGVSRAAWDRVTLPKMVIVSDYASARLAERRVLAELGKYGYNEMNTFAVKLALEEGLTNAIRHGNGADPGKNVEIVYEVNQRRTTITITDQGGGFDPDGVPDPTADENLEKPCGRGLMLMRAYMDEVRHTKRGSCVTMVKENR